MENPWNIGSIYELQYFVCPTCVFKNQSKQDIINHAYEFHPDSIEFLNNIKDNSLENIVCPWKTKIEDPLRCEIKSEESAENYQKINPLEVPEQWFQKNGNENIDTNLYKEHRNVNIENINDEMVEDFEIKTNDEDSQIIKCKLCSKSFSTKRSLIHHKKTIHVNKIPKEVCKICGKEVKYLQSHMKSHDDDKEVQKCEICFKTYSCITSLNIHIKNFHERKRDSKCDICGKIFGHGYLKRHILSVHKGVKKFSCDLCEKSFSTKKYLKNHKKTDHEGIIESCEICFKEVKHLQNHMKSHENDGEEKNEREKIHKCDICIKSFYTNAHLIRHKTFIHEDKSPLSYCTLCGKDVKYKYLKGLLLICTSGLLGR